MFTDLELEVPPELELLMAQELAVALMSRHVGFRMEPIEVVWCVGGSEQRPLPSVSGVHLITSDSPVERRSYIEKRIAVLCARAYATTLVLNRKADAEGSPQDQDLFWKSFDENGDHSRTSELCAAYLIEDTDKAKSSDPEQDFIEIQSQYIVRHGLLAVGEVLTEAEFLSFVDTWRSNFECSHGVFRTTIKTELLESYKPGIPTLKLIESDTPEKRHCDMPSDRTLLRQRRGQVDLTQSQRCLVAHEMGHWLAARHFEISTSGVKFNWQECSGSCTVYLGAPAFEWSLGKYLSARIAVLCAGSFADCWERRGENRSGIGDEFYRTLFSGTGVDDFAKLTELYLLFRTMQASPVTQPYLASPPGCSEILESLLKLLNENGLYQSLVSPEFEKLVTHLHCKAQSASAASINGQLELIDFKSEELDGFCKEFGLSLNGK